VGLRGCELRDVRARGEEVSATWPFVAGMDAYLWTGWAIVAAGLILIVWLVVMYGKGQKPR
jgi:hypothetical protein